MPLREKMIKKIKLVGLNARYTHSCLALFYVRNELEKHCPEIACELMQFTINDNYYESLLRLTAGDPDYVFFSASIWNSSLIEKLILDINLCLPGCRVVIGGPQAGIIGERLGVKACTVVLGEIEAVGSQFFTDVENGSLQDRYKGSFFSLKDRFFDYPYRSDDFDGHLQNRHIYYESSRGCPFGCTYCLSAAEKGVVHKEMGVVERELTDILSHKPKVVRFIDRTFNDRPDRALAIWKFLAAQKCETLFHFEIAPERFTPEMFTFLATVVAGRFQFELGIQSTHIPTLEAVNRRVDPGDAHSTVATLAKAGNIHLHVDLILGLPFETLESFSHSFRDIFAMGAHYIQMGLLKILPDTPICHGANEYGYLHSAEPPYSILKTKWMDHRVLSQLYWFSECVEKFMNNRYFLSLWRYLQNKNEDIYLFFCDILKACQERSFFQLAATQELMCKIIVRVIAGRADSKLIIDLLRYDWLRCGFRYLPDAIKDEFWQARPEETKSALYKSMPTELEGVYRTNNRNQFFRKSFFLQLSRDALAQLNLDSDSDSGCLCILPEREGGLYNFNKVLVLPTS